MPVLAWFAFLVAMLFCISDTEPSPSIKQDATSAERAVAAARHLKNRRARGGPSGSAPPAPRAPGGRDPRGARPLAGAAGAPPVPAVPPAGAPPVPVHGAALPAPAGGGPPVPAALPPAPAALPPVHGAALPPVHGRGRGRRSAATPAVVSATRAPLLVPGLAPARAADEVSCLYLKLVFAATGLRLLVVLAVLTQSTIPEKLTEHHGETVGVAGECC